MNLFLPFIASLLVILLLRRFDRKNINLRKFKNVIERGEKELSEVVIQKKEELKDNTTKFNLLIFDVEKYMKSLKMELDQVKSSVIHIQENRERFGQIEIQLADLEKVTHSIQMHLSSINGFLANADANHKKIQKMQEYIKKIDKHSIKMMKIFQEELENKSKEASLSMENRIKEYYQVLDDYQKEIREKTLFRQNQLNEDVMKKYEDLESSLNLSAEKLSANLQEKMEEHQKTVDDFTERGYSLQQNLEATIPKMLSRIEEDVTSKILANEKRLENLNINIDSTEKDIQSKLNFIEQEVSIQKKSIFDEFSKEMSSLKSKFQNIDQDVTNKKDEIYGMFQNTTEQIEEAWGNAREDIQKHLKDIREEVEEQKEFLLDRISKDIFKINEDIELSEKKSVTQRNEMLEMEENFHGKLECIRDELEVQKKSLFEGLFEEASSIREEIQKFDLDAMTKKDKMLQDVRKEASQIEKKLEEFNHAYMQNKENFAKELADYQGELHQKFNTLYLDSKQDIENVMDQSQKKIYEKLEDLYMTSQEKIDGSLKRLNEKEIDIKQLVKLCESDFKSMNSNITEMLQKSKGELEEQRGDILKKTEQSLQVILEEYKNKIKYEVGQMNDKAISLKHSAETWESRLESLSIETKEVVHKGRIDLENQRVEIIESSEKALMQVLSEYKIKVEDRHKQINADISVQTDQFLKLQQELELKQASFLEDSQGIRENLENALKTASEQKLNSFEQNAEKKAANFTKKFKEISEKNIHQIKQQIEKVSKSFHDIQEETRNNLKVFQKQQIELMASIRDENVKTSKELKFVQEALQNVKQETNIIELSRERVQEIKDVINDLAINVDHANKKNSDLKEFSNKVNELKNARLQLDSELSAWSQKQKTLNQIEQKLSLVVQLKDELEAKSESMLKLQSMVEGILATEKQLDGQRDKMDSILEEFVNQRNLVESAIVSLDERGNGFKDISQKVSELDQFLKKMEIKSQNIQSNMQSLSGQLFNLEEKKSEVESVKEKFSQIEDLIEDIDRRKKQIEMLRHKYEDLKTSMNSDLTEMEKIENNAEEKVKKLSEFTNAIDDTMKNISLNKDVKDLKKLSDHKKDVVVRLGQMGWTSEEIADKIKMDTATVQTILSTFSN